MLDVEQPAPELDSAPAPEAGTSQPEVDSLDSALLEQQAQPEEIEDELEGVKLRGPKDVLERIKAERLMQADYTRKTQEVAEQRRTIEQERERFQEAARLHQEHIREVGALVSIQERLAQFQNVNWAQLNADNPQQAQALHIEFTQLQSRGAQLANSLAQRNQARQLEAQQEQAKRANDAEQIVMREVKDWGPEKLSKFVDAGVKAGMEADGVRQLLVQFPQAARFLNKALQYDQLLASRMQKKPAEPQKPVTRIGGGSAANTKPLSEVTDPREWAERRRERKSQSR
jgi:hypothetical protein